MHLLSLVTKFVFKIFFNNIFSHFISNKQVQGKTLRDGIIVAGWTIGGTKTVGSD